MTERQLLENYAKASYMLCGELYELKACEGCPLNMDGTCYLCELLDKHAEKYDIDPMEELNIN